MQFLGIDTSNYTTSAAFFSDGQVYAANQLLQVKHGQLGLRQSDALFQHIKSLPNQIALLCEKNLSYDKISAIAVSTAPRAVEGSYMPCFLAGISHAKTLSSVLNVPLFEVSHQQGHIFAGAYGADRMDILNSPFLAWHLSGGTTELLYVTPHTWNVSIQILGCSEDISAGQLVDRVGVTLGLSFPAGKALDALSLQSENDANFRVKQNEFSFSLSGIENKAKQMIEKGDAPCDIARFIMETISDIILRITASAKEKYGNIPVLFSGGVSANTIIKQRLSALHGIFPPIEYATDNAAGVAILAHRGANWK